MSVRYNDKHNGLHCAVVSEQSPFTSELVGSILAVDSCEKSPIPSDHCYHRKCTGHGLFSLYIHID